MSTPRALLAAGALAFACVLAGEPASAQAIHLPSTYRPNLPKGVPLLTFRVIDKTEYPAETRIMVHDDQIVLMVPGKGAEFYPIGNRTLSGIANDIQSRHDIKKLEIRANYPFHPARDLPEMSAPVALDASALTAQGDRPQVGFGFGGVFSLGSGRGEQNDGLLDQTGFQLDLVGSYQWTGPRATAAGQPAATGAGVFGPIASFWQVRLGLNSDQSLNVVTESEREEGGDQSVTTDFMAAVEQADQVAMTTQMDFVLPIRESAMEFVLVPEASITWTRTEPYQFPLLPRVVGGDPQASEALFTASAIESARQRLDATRPLTTYGATSVVRFKRDGRVSYYAGVGPLWTQIPRRTIRYRRFPPNAPDPGAIDPNFIGVSVGSERVTYGRVIMGARLGGTLDLRAEALVPGGLGDKPADLPGRPDFNTELPHILRLIIVKDFPVVR